MKEDKPYVTAAWATYVQARRREHITKLPIVDILIGIFAQRLQGLLTYNPRQFLPLVA
ncbi:MAG: hypothetical protein WCL57_09490 [Chloroflexota bacterium]|nr:hypothetical protein [Chloroflexota bacterium]